VTDTATIKIALATKLDCTVVRAGNWRDDTADKQPEYHPKIPHFTSMQAGRWTAVDLDQSGTPTASYDIEMPHHPPQMIAVLTPFPHSVEVDAPVAEAREFMHEHDIRHLPVTEHGKLIGIISDRDIKLLLSEDFKIESKDELKVRDAYVVDPYIVDVCEPLERVLDTMAERHIGSALVTKKGKLVGIFTGVDACRHFAELIRQAYRTLDGDDAA
jgi:acetoin utilization protein AcuB